VQNMQEQIIRDGSFFSGSHLSIETIIVIVYCRANDFPQKNIIAEAELSPTTSSTVVDWCSFCRDVCEQDLISHRTEIVGLDEDTLEPKVVEIDESKFFHRKYHRVSGERAIGFSMELSGVGESVSSSETLSEIILR
jgi:hypothetical protein